MNAWRFVLFTCGQLGLMVLARFFFTWVQPFGSPPDAAAGSSVLFPAALFGAVLFGFRIFDSVTDPIAGAISDAWVRRGRQRRNLLWFSFLLPAIGLAVIFLPDTSMGGALRWTLATGGMLVFFVGYTLYGIPYWSLIDDYSQGDPGRKRLLSNLLGVGLLGATAIIGVLSPDLVEQLGFFWAAVFFASLAVILMLLPWFASPPGVQSEPIPATMPAWRSLLAALKHRRFVALMVLLAGSQMSFTVMTSASAFIAVDLLGGSKADVKILLGPLIFTALPCFALVPWLARKLGWQRSLVGASLLLGLVYAGSAGLGVAVIGSPLLSAGLLFGLGGPMVAVLLGLEGEAVLSCASERGPGNTSVYFGVYNLVVKTANGLALWLTGILISLSQGSWGTTAVRAMGISAGALLGLGVLVYAVVRPRDTPTSPEQPA